jgi:hypothetical protein
MRTNQQIQSIKKRVSDPFCVESFLAPAEVDHLIQLHDLADNKDRTFKNTGPVTLNLNQFYEDPVVARILASLVQHIGEYQITTAFFFYTPTPHIIHNDDTFELPETVHKAITLPLKLEGFSGVYPKLCFFDQFYFHGPAKFFNGSTNVPTFYNAQVYDYAEVDGIVNVPFESDEELSHLKSSWLEGLSLHSAIEWRPTNALIFDSTRLHCASDFRKVGVKSKLGISIFTKSVSVS